METPEIRLKRLKLRSMRRGIREMDILLSRFADTVMPLLSARDLDRYEKLLEETDQDVLMWVTGQIATPSQFSALISKIRDSA